MNGFTARFKRSSWPATTAPPGSSRRSHSGSDFRDTSLVLDSSGRPHVSYYDYGANGSSTDLKYAFFDGAAWTITTVDANNAGEHNSLALDSLGRPRIAYIGSGAARFASFDGNAWTTQSELWTVHVVGTDCEMWDVGVPLCRSNTRRNRRSPYQNNPNSSVPRMTARFPVVASDTAGYSPTQTTEPGETTPELRSAADIESALSAIRPATAPMGKNDPCTSAAHSGSPV